MAKITPTLANILVHDNGHTKNNNNDMFLPFSFASADARKLAAPDSGSEDSDPDEDDDVWNNFLEGDQQAAASPPPCSCHQFPVGSCPAVLQFYVDWIRHAQSIPGRPANMDFLRIPLPKPSFNLPAWKTALGSYFDAGELLRGFRFGWDVCFLSPPHPKDAQRNLPSADFAKKDVDKYIKQELEHGTLLGPFNPDELPFPVAHSPIGTVEKPRSETRRTIIDCSQRTLGINAWISAHLHRGQVWKLTLPNTRAIVEMVQTTRKHYPGTRLLMFKVDMSRWYRFLLIDPIAATFFAIRWGGKTFLDLAYSFGNRGAALVAQRVIWALCYLYRCKVSPRPNVTNSGTSCRCRSHCSCGQNSAVAYIDDVVAVCPEHLADYLFNEFIQMCNRLDVTLSTTPGHIVPPSAVCTALGLEYNLDKNTVRLPRDKLFALIDLLSSWMSRSEASEKNLCSLAGKLINAAAVVASGRLFTNRILATKRRATGLDVPVILDSAFKDDIAWWLEALHLRNGITFLEHHSTVHIAKDASSNGWYNELPGIGVYNFSNHEYIACTPPEHLRHLIIADLELLAHVLAANVWGSSWNGHQVTGETDSSACFYLLQNGRTRHEIRLKMSRFFASSQVKNCFRWKTQWIATEENVLPDALSRLGSKKYRDLFQAHCDKLGGIPRQRHVHPEMFNFD